MRGMGERLLGALPRDGAVAEALARQMTLLEATPNSRAAADLRDLARAVDAKLRRIQAAALTPAAGEPGGFALARWAAR